MTAPARRSAVVSGSTSGIGWGIARALGEAGMNVMLNGFGEPAEIERMRADLDARSAGTIRYHPADMSRPEEIEALAASARAAFGSIDVVVNNAGIQHVAPVEDFPVERWNAILAVNLSSAFHLIRATVAEMKAHGWGRIVNIASAHALVASPYKCAYVAAKHGVLGLTKTIALETAEHGVTVNAICPGYVKTPLVEKQIPDTAAARGITEEEVIRNVLLAAQPTRRFVTVEEVASLVVYLCSEAGASINGCALPMDGGWTAQ